MNTSPGVWLLAWRRFERDRLGLACLVVVLIYAAVMVACAAGWIVRDWSEEVAVTYAPPTFLGPEAPRGASSAAAAETAPQAALEDYGIPDPLADDLAEIARELAGTSATETRAATLAFGAEERRWREADAGFFLPVAGEPAGGNSEHQRDVGEHHDEREEAEPVAAEAPPRECPDARLSHLSCTRGSIAL